MTTTTTTRKTTTDLVRADDLQAHIEDSIKVNAIRNGKLIEVYWNELTPDEQRAANAVLFDLYHY